MNIYLIGFMGTGKSTIGHALAQRIGWEFLDLDQMIEEREGRSIPDIFSAEGEVYFREKEATLLAEVAEGDKQVVSTGGGAVIFPSNRERMKATGFVISLHADKETIRDRVARQAGRPLLDPRDFDRRYDMLMKERKRLYEQADLQLDTSSLSVEEMIERIVQYPSFPVR